MTADEPKVGRRRLLGGIRVEGAAVDGRKESLYYRVDFDIRVFE
jgi:hypothetical protein